MGSLIEGKNSAACCYGITAIFAQNLLGVSRILSYCAYSIHREGICRLFAPDDGFILVMLCMKPAQNIISPDNEISGISLRRGLFSGRACDTSARIK